ncbi:hypothetical protein LJB42_003265 [Komagataella kurtzmanii]|nr:hypothetical protein LJB42_003265 [Komagataella kurtzmanii]
MSFSIVSSRDSRVMTDMESLTLNQQKNKRLSFEVVSCRSSQHVVSPAYEHFVEGYLKDVDPAKEADTPEDADKLEGDTVLEDANESPKSQKSRAHSNHSHSSVSFHEAQSNEEELSQDLQINQDIIESNPSLDDNQEVVSLESLPPKASLTDLPSKLLDIIASFLPQQSAINLSQCAKKLIPSTRKRLLRKVVFVNSWNEACSLQRELNSNIPSTIVSMEKMIPFFSTIRLSSGNLGSLVKELWCFASVTWESGLEFTINDSWFLVAQHLTNMDTLIWPQLPILKYSILPLAIRLKIKSLCVGISQINNNNLVSFDNNVLSFPNLKHLAINMDHPNGRIENSELVSNLLVWGGTLDNLETLAISGSLNEVLSKNLVFHGEESRKPMVSVVKEEKFPENPKEPVKELPRTPVLQQDTYRIPPPPESTTAKKNKLHVNFTDKLRPKRRVHSEEDPASVEPSAFKPLSPVINPVSAAAFPISQPSTSPPQQAPPSNPTPGSPFQQQNVKPPTQSSLALDDLSISKIWSSSLRQIKRFNKLRINTLSLDKILIDSNDINVLFDCIEFEGIKRLEMRNVVHKYNGHVNTSSISAGDQLLLSFMFELGSRLDKVEELSLDIKFMCSHCHKDCQLLERNYVIKFLNQLPPLKSIHLTSHELRSLNVKHLSKHTQSLRKLSFSNPSKLEKLIIALKQQGEILNNFWETGSGTRIDERLLTHFNNNVARMPLINDVFTPSLDTLNDDLSNYKRKLFSTNKYQLLSVFGLLVDEYETSFPLLTDLTILSYRFELKSSRIRRNAEKFDRSNLRYSTMFGKPNRQRRIVTG